MFLGRIPFDPEFYAAQAGVEPSDQLLSHYMREGFRLGYAPTRFFDPQWYAWENLNSKWGNRNPYAHYLRKGRFQGRDPSPLVDMQRYDQVLGARYPKKLQYEAIVSGIRSPALGVYEDWKDLDRAQSRFMGAISCSAHRLSASSAKRPYLIVLQAGPKSAHRSWFRENDRTFDVLVNYFDAKGFDPHFGDFVFFQIGTKFTAMANLLERHPEIFQAYRYILLLDDDILTSTSDLNRLFLTCEAFRLDLAQMSLSPKSSTNWPVFFNKGVGCRFVSGVEVMMPVFSQNALFQVKKMFRKSISGWGLDLLIAKKLQNAKKNNIAVIDDLIAHHLKQSDEANGAYYSYLRSNHINPKAELWRLISENSLDTSFKNET